MNRGRFFHGQHGANRNFYKKTSQTPRCRQDFNNARPTTIRMIIEGQCEQARGVEVTYTNDPVEVEAWLRNNVIEPDMKALGFDMEWKPQFVAKKKGGKENKTAVVQLSIESSALVLHIIHMKTLPRFLVEILTDQSIHKLGCAIRGDVAKLLRDTGLHCKGALDLPDIALKSGYSKQHGCGLKRLATNVLGIQLYKPKKVQMSNWENQPLNSNQIVYAALDAWIAIKIYLHMQQKNGPDARCEVDDLVDSEVKFFCCSVCSKKCRDEDKLQQHMAKARHAECNSCGQLFVSRRVPETHRAVCFRSLVNPSPSEGHSSQSSMS